MLAVVGILISSVHTITDRYQLGPVEASSVTPNRIALSVPLVNAHIHHLAAGPIFASHSLDLQIFPVPDESAEEIERSAHVGPPSINLEAKLARVDDQAIENGSDPIGALTVRGPIVGKVLGTGEDSYIEVPPSSTSNEGWVATGETAKVLTNGAFKVVAAKK